MLESCSEIISIESEAFLHTEDPWICHRIISVEIEAFLWNAMGWVNPQVSSWVLLGYGYGLEFSNPCQTHPCNMGWAGFVIKSQGYYIEKTETYVYGCCLGLANIGQRDTQEIPYCTVPPKGGGIGKKKKKPPLQQSVPTFQTDMPTVPDSSEVSGPYKRKLSAKVTMNGDPNVEQKWKKSEQTQRKGTTTAPTKKMPPMLAPANVAPTKSIPQCHSVEVEEVSNEEDQHTFVPPHNPRHILEHSNGSDDNVEEDPAPEE